MDRLQTNVKPRSYSPFDALKEPKSTEPDDIRRWIVAIGKETYTTPTELANKADLAPSTINKFMADTDNSRNINARTLNKIKKAAWDLIEARSSADKNYVEHEFGITADGDLPLIHSNPYYVRDIKVVGHLYDHGLRVQDGVQMEERFMYDIAVPIGRRFIGKSLCALQLNTPDPEEYYGYQDIFICQPYWIGEGKVLNGDRLVVAELDSYPGQMRLSMRDFISDPKGHNWLVSPFGSQEDSVPIYAGRGPKRSLPDGTAILFIVAGSYHMR